MHLQHSLLDHLLQHHFCSHYFHVVLASQQHVEHDNVVLMEYFLFYLGEWNHLVQKEDEEHVQGEHAVLSRLVQPWC